MPARDIYHDALKNALIKDDWIITDDPLHIKWGLRDMYVDLGAKKLLAAQKAENKIAVEIKSFISPSEIQDFKEAIGSFVLYRAVMNRVEPERTLYLAVRDNIYNALFQEPIGTLLVESDNIYLIVFNVDEEEIVQWIP